MPIIYSSYNKYSFYNLINIFYPVFYFKYLEMRFKSKAARLTGTTIGLTAQVCALANIAI